MENYACVFLTVAMATLLASASSQQSRCEPITVPMCKDIGYNHTVFPNPFNHTTQEAAHEAMVQFSPLFSINCSQDLRPFLCAAYVPPCVENYKADILPCRSLCQSAMPGCQAIMRKFGFRWPDELNCDTFPDGRDQICIDWNVSNLTKNSTQPTTAVNRPPHIFTNPEVKDIYFEQGKTMKLPCAATGTPEPSYRWQRNGYDFNPADVAARVNQMPENGTLVFDAPDDKDEGIYQCFADNGHGVSASVKMNVIAAKLGRFRSKLKSTHYVDEGKSLTLNCVPPESYPPAVVEWVIKEPDMSWQPANIDSRITMDLEGRLHFTAIRKSDEQLTYVCVATNPFLRRTEIVAEHMVEVWENEEQQIAASELWTSPQNQKFLRGETLRLKCIFAGNDEPATIWQRVGGPLPYRATSFGQELMITNLSYSDSGQYRCKGYATMLSKTFNIWIESAPYWTAKPQPEEKGVGDSATFICETDAVPPPTYSWFINGVPIDDVKDPRIAGSPRVHRPTPTNLTISDLSLGDAMVIQCNASNPYGYVWADVSLIVLAPPTTPPVPTTIMTMNSTYPPTTISPGTKPIRKPTTPGTNLTRRQMIPKPKTVQKVVKKGLKQLQRENLLLDSERLKLSVQKLKTEQEKLTLEKAYLQMRINYVKSARRPRPRQ